MDKLPNGKVVKVNPLVEKKQKGVVRMETLPKGSLFGGRFVRWKRGTNET